ncbi:hypothetical protein ACGRL8_10430 [Vibrio rumoiensis]|uniref:Uncharacterized protein n=1 Tax=Vibrio rumoiensis TaxID=76258 RepID=A0ABW7IXY9_9VIBR|nr:hypothetical protein [Vibrio rumoiensis]
MKVFIILLLSLLISAVSMPVLAMTWYLDHSYIDVTTRVCVYRLGNQTRFDYLSATSLCPLSQEWP